MSDPRPCGCEAPADSADISNAPGQPALRYRIGDWSAFFDRMKADLSRFEIPDGERAGERPLAELSTRSVEDPAIALLDAVACVGDVLTFYQERIANEGFLRTATERVSVLHLADAIGYVLNPGVGASAWLAFTVEDAPTAPGAATVAVGLAVQSVPGQDESSQTFETTEAATVRAAWNALQPQQTERQLPLSIGDRELYIEGTANQLQPGDAVLIVGDERAKLGSQRTPPSKSQDERWDLRILDEVEVLASKGLTRLAWREGLGLRAFGVTIAPAQQEPVLYALRVRTPVFGHNAQVWITQDLEVRRGWYDHYLSLGLRPKGEGWPSGRASWPVSASTGRAIGWDTTNGDEPKDWPYRDFPVVYDRWTTDPNERSVDLEGEHKAVREGTWVALRQGGNTELGLVKAVRFGTRVDFGVTAKITRVALDTREVTVKVDGPDAKDELDATRYPRAATTVFAGSEALRLAERPLSTPFPSLSEQPVGSLDGPKIRMNAVIEGLVVGQRLIIAGPLADTAGLATGEDGVELAQIAAIDEDDPAATALVLSAPTKNRYVRDTVKINANIVPANHGETVATEVLGSGDGAASHQRFTLRKTPLTWVSADTPSGGAPALALRVGGVLWKETPTLYGAAPDAEVYQLRVDDDDRTTVTFGDGLSGARLPTGQENLSAVYRIGLGLQGNVRADTLQILRRRPLGVRGVTNPLPATGGEDREALAQARDNAPLTVLTLDRLVSRTDFEDFAAAFSGVAKARATEVWTGERRRVALTVAGAGGVALAPGDAAYDNLSAAIDRYKDPVQSVLLVGYTPVYFRVAAELKVDERYEPEVVFAAAEAALRAAFSFDRRAFGQSVTAAEILALLQGIDGVIAVDLNALVGAAASSLTPPDTVSPPPPEATLEAGFHAVLSAETAAWVGGALQPAQILLLDPGYQGVLLQEMSA